MSRGRGAPPLAISLFPFLAVLICTMGSLIVLLVLLIQRARFDRAREPQIAAVRPVSANSDDQERQAAQQRLEDAAWREELLRKQRDAQAQALAERRLQLSHLEDHIRRLKQEAEQLLVQAQREDEGKRLSAEQLAAAQARLAELEREIAQKQAEIARRKEEDAARDKWYALIPYDGPNGTRRRPIYIECTEIGVILQPEGIVFSPQDFSGPLGPGNPLDAALRTIREFLVRGGGESGQAYPLLVVRPSGVVAYQAARQALGSWDEEFGYELVEEDKQLAFGQGNRDLEALLQRTIGAARVKQQALAAAMPNRFSGEPPLVSFNASDQTEVREARAAAGFSPGGASGGASGVGSGAAIAPALTPGSLGGGNTGAPIPGAGLAAAGGAGAAQELPGLGLTGGGQNQGFPGQTGAGGGGLANSSGGATGGGYVNPGATSGPGGPLSGGAGAPNLSGLAAGSPSGGGANATASGANSGSSASNPLRTSGASATGASRPSGSATGGGATSGGTSNPGAMAGGSGGSGSAGGGRGQNWGLPGAAGRTTAITRPVRVACLTDRLIVYPDVGDARRPVEIAGQTQLTLNDVTNFVGAVQREISTWGLAVANGYWKPVLQVDVAPGAEERFQTLQAALEGSGFAIQRKLR